MLVIAGGPELEGMDQGLSHGILLGGWLEEFYDCKVVAEIQNDYDELRVMNTNPAASCTAVADKHRSEDSETIPQSQALEPCLDQVNTCLGTIKINTQLGCLFPLAVK